MAITEGERPSKESLATYAITVNVTGVRLYRIETDVPRRMCSLISASFIF